MEAADWKVLRKLNAIADYQFGRGVGKALLRGEIRIQRSRKTGRVRYIYDTNGLIATLRPKDGFLALTPGGATKLVSGMKRPPHVVRVQDDVAEFISAGRSVFAKHVIQADKRIRPKDEVLVLSQSGNLLAVGRAVLSGVEMPLFKLGIAVSVRKGASKL
jgi:7-cyano-7-deazaguanine tRNA-ribosyltransferase